MVLKFKTLQPILAYTSAGRNYGTKRTLPMGRVYTVLLKITKGKAVSAQAMKAYSGNESISPLTNSALDEGRWLASRPSWFNPGERVRLNRTLDKRHSWSGRFEKKVNILCQVSNPEAYWLQPTTDYAIPAPAKSLVNIKSVVF